MPMPVKFPRMSLAVCSYSLDGIYTEWGSRFSRIVLTVISTMLSVFTLSTYSKSIKSISLLSFCFFELEENSVSLTVVKFSLAPRKMPRWIQNPVLSGVWVRFPSWVQNQSKSKRKIKALAFLFLWVFD